MESKLRLLATLAVLTLCFHQGCDLPTRHPAVPPALVHKTEIPGMPGVRTWDDSPPAVLTEIMLEAYEKRKAYLVSQKRTGPVPPQSSLVLSGGGEHGAFGAGLLVGWTASGTRPEFFYVSGVSTGALMAPFAFLGPEYDGILREFYTEVTAKDIYRPRPMFKRLFSVSMTSTKPLRKRIRRYIDKKLLDAVAAECAKGRLLLIGTTNLDAKKSVTWYMCKIASSGDPGALKLFQDVLIASSAIPVQFPPQLINVELQGKTYQEMHVDGAVMSQVLSDPPSLKPREVAETAGVASSPETLYVIENCQLRLPGKEVKTNILDIATHAISCLYQAATIAELDVVYDYVRENDIAFKLAYIPHTFDVPSSGEFDRDYMDRLFDFAYDLAAKGYPWETMPPNFTGPRPAPSGTQ